jgi:mRNA interferase MazF
MKSGSPDTGDFIWIDLDPTKGHEQRGSRPALVLTPRAYNERTGLCVACRITSQVKGYPFEVPIPPGQAITGTVLSDQLRCLSWPERNMRIVGAAPAEILDEVRAKLVALIGIE